MRICFPFVGDAVGGSHISAAELITKLPPAIQTLVLLHRQGPLAEYLKSRKITFDIAPRADIVESAPLGRQMWAMGSVAPRLADFLRARGIDLVHTNDARMHMTWLLATKLGGARLVWHQRSRTDLRRLGLYMRLADAVVTISEFCRQSLPHKIAKRARVIDNPFDTTASPDRSTARQRLLADLGAETAEGVIAFVGNFTQQKRPKIFLEMARELNLKWEGLTFAMFGEEREPLRQQLISHLAAIGLSERCYFMGPRYPIGTWIAGCDVLVAPAVAEGSGRALVEAMLVGTPVVATNEGGHREIIKSGETGYLVPADNPEEFARATARLLNDRELHGAIAQRAHEKAKRRFAAERHVETMVSLYRELVDGPSRGPG